MTKFSIDDIKREILNFLRNSDILTISARGVTTTTEEFDGTGAQTVFTLTSTPVRNIRTVTVDAVAQTFGDDFTFDLNASTITFLVAPASGTDNVDITYDNGSTDKIFPDFPKPTTDLSDFPRIGFDILSGSSSEFEIGGGSQQTNYIVSVVVYARGTSFCDKTIATIRSKFQDNKKSFFFFPFITPTALGPMLVAPFGEQKITQRNQDLNIRFVFDE